MGYLKINTENTGEVVVDGKRILYVKKTGQAIDLIVGLFDGLETGTKSVIRVNGSGITEETKEKFNKAVIDAQGVKAVDVTSRGTEVFQSISLDPA